MASEKRIKAIQKAKRDAVASMNNIKPVPVSAPKKVKSTKKKRPSKQNKAFTKASRMSRSKDARRWSGWRTTDGMENEVTTYKASDLKED